MPPKRKKKDSTPSGGKKDDGGGCLAQTRWLDDGSHVIGSMMGANDMGSMEPLLA